MTELTVPVQEIWMSQIMTSEMHRHTNEREKEIYSNEDIIPERSSLNVHFKEPTGSYAEMFEQMKADNIISTRGLKRMPSISTKWSLM